MISRTKLNSKFKNDIKNENTQGQEQGQEQNQIIQKSSIKSLKEQERKYLKVKPKVQERYQEQRYPKIKPKVQERYQERRYPKVNKNDIKSEDTQRSTRMISRTKTPKS